MLNKRGSSVKIDVLKINSQESILGGVLKQLCIVAKIKLGYRSFRVSCVFSKYLQNSFSKNYQQASAKLLLKQNMVNVSSRAYYLHTNKNTNFRLCFFLSIVSEVTVRKNSKQTLPQVKKVTVQKLVLRQSLLTIRLKSIVHLPTCSS